MKTLQDLVDFAHELQAETNEINMSDAQLDAMLLPEAFAKTVDDLFETPFLLKKQAW